MNTPTPPPPLPHPTAAAAAVAGTVIYEENKVHTPLDSIFA